MAVSKDFQHEDNLDYNDGLGDLLRGKERREFSWTKTALVMAFVVFIVFIVLVAVFSIGKSMFLSSSQKEPAIPEAILKDIEKVEKEMDMPPTQNTKTGVPGSVTLNAPAKTEVKKPSAEPIVKPKVEKPKPVEIVHQASVPAQVAHPKVIVHKPVVHQPHAKKAKAVKATLPAKHELKPVVGGHTQSPYKLIVKVCDTKEQVKAFQKILASKKIDNYCWASSDKPVKYYIQAGAFASSAEAEKYLAILKTKGFSPFVQKK